MLVFKWHVYVKLGKAAHGIKQLILQHESLSFETFLSELNEDYASLIFQILYINYCPRISVAKSNNNII